MMIKGKDVFKTCTGFKNIFTLNHHNKQQTMNTAVLVSLAPTPSKLKVRIKDILIMEL